MSFEWDAAKREINLAKHGVNFLRAIEIFGGDVIEEIERRRNYGEERIRCLGEVDGTVYAVAYTWRGEHRRIISARRANVRETRNYRAHDARGGAPTS